MLSGVALLAFCYRLSPIDMELFLHFVLYLTYISIIMFSSVRVCILYCAIKKNKKKSAGLVNRLTNALHPLCACALPLCQPLWLDCVVALDFLGVPGADIIIIIIIINQKHLVGIVLRCTSTCRPSATFCWASPCPCGPVRLKDWRNDCRL